MQPAHRANKSAPEQLYPGEMGIDRVGSRVSAPIALTSPQAPYTDEARKAQVEGICLVSLIVDAHGMPQDARVVRSLNPGLDQNAIQAVYRYRFKPALKDGWQPVPVMITAEVHFRLH